MIGVDLAMYDWIKEKSAMGQWPTGPDNEFRNNFKFTIEFSESQFIEFGQLCNPVQILLRITLNNVHKPQEPIRLKA